MTYQAIKITETFDRQGEIVKTERLLYGTFDDPIALLVFCYALAPETGYLISLDDQQCVRLERQRDGKRFDFADIFRYMEGEERHKAVLDGSAPAQNEKDWLASKLAG